MKANTTYNRVAINKHLSSIYSRLGSLSIVSRQSVLGILVVCLTMFSGNAWGETTYTYDFSSVNNFYTTKGGNVHPTAGTDHKYSNGDSFYGSDGAQFTVLYDNKVYFSTGYIMVGNQSPVFQLPTYSGEKITQVKFWNSSGCSTSVKITIKAGSSTASAEQTWSTQSSSYTYTIGSDYQASTLKLNVVSANAQITKIAITTEPILYTITLHDNNGGSNNGSATVQADATSLKSGFTPPTRTGYTIEGYYTNAVCTTKVATDEGVLRASITVGGNEWTNSSSQWKRGANETFYTKWTAKQSTITFDKNSGTGGDNGTTGTYGSAMPTVDVPTRKYYTFGGYWDGAGGTGTQYYKTDGTSNRNWDKNTTSTTTLYAKWTAKSYTNYRTTCCTKLSAIGGAVSINDPVSVDLTWDMIDHVDSWTVAYKEHSDDDWTTVFSEKTSSDSEISEIDSDDDEVDDSYKTTITGLSCNTAYDFRITANPATDYCEKVQVLDNSGSGYNTGKWAVAYTLTDDHVEKTDGPDAGENVCGNFEATFEAVTGYILPSTITVTIGGASATAGTDYTWTKATGELEIAAAKITGDLAITITGEEKSCNANPTIGVPTLTSITSGTITVSCPTIGSGSGCEISDYGFYYVSGGDDPTTSDTKAQKGTDDCSTAFEKAISISFTTGTTYKFKAYATNDKPATTLSATSLTVVPRSITFDSKGGSSVTAQYVNSGTATTTPTAPTKTGYTFSKWQLSGEDYDFSSTVSSDITLDAVWTANSYGVTLNANGGVGDDQTVSATYNAEMPTKTTSEAAIVLPTKEGYTFTGYWDATSGGNKYYNANGTSAASWNYATTKTLYAQWTINSYKVSVASVDNVTISSTTPSAAEGAYNTANYNSTVTLSYSSVASGKYWGGWVVYKDGEESVKVTVTNNQFTLPAYDVVVSAFLYGDLKAWCDPDVEVTGDVHLTSYNGISVNSTSAAGNLIEISSSDMGSATKMEVAYLNADAADAEVDKDESVFRFCNNGTTNYNVADENAIDLDYEWGTSHSIKYTPNAYDQRDNYKLQLTFKRGDKVLKTVTHAIYGRALPEEFVIASKYLGHWYALPNTMGTSPEAVTPIQITVDNATTPTKASYAPSTTVYKGAARYRPGNNVNAIRFTSTSSNWLETGATAQLKLSTTATPTEGVENKQVFYLNSSTFGVYELANSGKKLGMYSGNMGMYADPAYTSEDIYLLPITNKYTPVDATATDWTGDAIGVTASTSATKMGIAQEDGTETDPVTLSSSGTSHAADFDGDIDFTGLKDKTLWLTWYDGSDNLVGGSQVTVPSIVLAGANDEWSDFASAPTLDDIVVLSKPMTIDEVAKAKQIVIDQSGYNTGKLVINADQSLIVDGKISKFDGAFGGTSASDLAILSDEDGTGALITGEASDNTQAAVQFYSKARYESGYVNQFIGVPLSSMTAYNGFYGTSLRVYDDANDKWQVLGNNAAMYPFTAYNLMRKETSAGTLYMEGALNLPGVDGTKTLEMGSRVGDYLFANSWTAPIDVTALEAGDFSDANATIYIFNAGTSEDYKTNGKDYSTGNHDNPGQWLYMPVEAVKETPSDFSLTVIPSMQAFMVTSTAANATLTLDYKKHVYDPAKTSGAAIDANRAPRREASEAKHEIIRVRVEGTSGYADDLLLFIGNDFSNGYDNGWEAYKVSGKAYTPQLYAVTEDGKKAISAQPDADNTVIGFKAGTEDDVYTFTLDYEGNDASLYLHDTYTDDYVRVEKDATYTFLTTDNTDHPRFVLTRFNAPQVTTGVDDVQWNGSKARKLMIDGILYIIRDGRIYNAEGALVK